MVDAWVLPAYGYTPSEYPFKVALQRNIADRNVYRVWRPYRSEEFPLADKNTSAYSGQIVFDVTDPDHVVVKAGPAAGWNTNSGEMYNFDMLGYMLFDYGYDMWDEVLSYLENNYQPFSTFKDGVITVNKSVFDISSSIEHYYTWGQEIVESTITFPNGSAIETVEASENEAPAVYYNMQGVRISCPTEGVVIRVQGNEAQKILIK